MASETEQGREAREMAEATFRDAAINMGFQQGTQRAILAVAAAIREQTQVLREANGV